MISKLVEQFSGKENKSRLLIKCPFCYFIGYHSLHFVPADNTNEDQTKNTWNGSLDKPTLAYLLCKTTEEGTCVSSVTDGVFTYLEGTAGIKFGTKLEAEPLPVWAEK